MKNVTCTVFPVIKTFGTWCDTCISPRPHPQLECPLYNILHQGGSEWQIWVRSWTQLVMPWGVVPSRQNEGQPSRAGGEVLLSPPFSSEPRHSGCWCHTPMVPVVVSHKTACYYVCLVSENRPKTGIPCPTFYVTGKLYRTWIFKIKKKKKKAAYKTQLLQLSHSETWRGRESELASASQVVLI